MYYKTILICRKIRASWKCTMCKDITPIVLGLRQQNNLIDFSFGHLEQTIINRILLELYCQNDISKHFMNCPDKIFVWLIIVDIILVVKQEY